MWPLNFDQTFKLLSTLGALSTFIWTVYVWRDKTAKDIGAAKVEANRLSETRRIEATMPFLNRQLQLYTEATTAASILSTSDNGEEVRKATARFWQLYWGELGMVENRDVEKAMKELGDAIEASKPKDKLKYLALNLAHACRKSLDQSWGINAWTGNR